MIIFGVQGIIFPLELFPRFILHRASPPFCSRYIFSSPLLVQLAVQGRNLLETSFLSTSSPLRLPFNLFLRLFLRLHFRSSRPSSSSWIFSLDLFLVNSNFFFDLIPPSDFLFICSSLSKLFPPDPLVALLFPFISVFIVFHFQLLAAPETSYPSFFISSFFFVFSFLFFLSSYKLYIQLFLNINLVSFSYFTFGRSLHREFRLPSSFLLSHVYILLLGVSSLKCRALQAPQSHLVIQLSEVEEGEYPFSLSFCAIHVQSSWRAIITKWTKREVLLTSSWHEPCGPSFAVSRKTCLHFYILANVRR